MPRLNTWLEQLIARRGTDLHLSPNAPPTARVDGRLASLEPRSLDDITVAREVFNLLNPAQTAAFDQTGNVVFAYQHDEASIFRVHFTRCGQGYRAVFRHRAALPDPTALGIPSALLAATSRSSGLVLVTGRRAAGKRTTAACLLNAIAAAQAIHIVSLESPSQMPVAPGRAHVTTREVGVHVNSLSEGLESLRFENADVVFVGHLTPENSMAVLDLARSGPLVIGLLEAPDVLGALRILETHDPNRKNVRTMLAESLVAASAQTLIHRDDRPGAICAFELLLRDDTVTNALANGALDEIWRHMGEASQSSSTRFDRCMAKWVADGTLTNGAAQRALAGTEAGRL